MEEEGGKPEDPALEAEVNADRAQKSNGWEIGYQTFTVNGRCLGNGDPIRVKEGEKVRLRHNRCADSDKSRIAPNGAILQAEGDNKILRVSGS